MGDIVAGLDPGAVGRRILGRGDDLDRSILLRDRQAEPAVIAVGGGPHRFEVGRFEIRGMRVERGEHSVDRALDQHMIVDLVDIIGADPLEHTHEGFEFLVGIDIGCGERAGGHRDQCERTDQCKGRE